MKQPAPDLIVAGKYCLEGQLAAGGMGSVWVARHLDLDLDIAIKFMDPTCATEEGFKRFELEAKAAAHLQSPYVVNVIDYGVDDELPYIVMELLNGEDLEDRLQRVKRISLAEAQKILSQAAKALRRAQELGIIHRDIKPHNLFLSKGDDESEETLKILDFGIAKEMGPALVGEGTNTGSIVGSPNYMSPEHVRGARDIDSRSDLWSLGVVMFQALTGRLPFPGDVVGDVIGMILADPIPRATEIAPDLPPEIDEFFFKALQRDRSLRFQSAREMADAFAELVTRSSLPPSLRAASPASEAPSGGVKRSEAPTQPIEPQATKAVTTHLSNEDTLAKNAVVDTKPPSRRGGSRWGALAAASVVFVAALGGVIALLRGPSSTNEPGASAQGSSVAGAQSADPKANAAPNGGDPTSGEKGSIPITPDTKQPAEPPSIAVKPAGAGDKAGTSASGQSATGAAPTIDSAVPAPTHVGTDPAFGSDLTPSTAAGSATSKTKSGSTTTTKPTGTAKTPGTSSSAKPKWGF